MSQVGVVSSNILGRVSSATGNHLEEAVMAPFMIAGFNFMAVKVQVLRDRGFLKSLQCKKLGNLLSAVSAITHGRHTSYGARLEPLTSGCIQGQSSTHTPNWSSEDSALHKLAH